MIESTQVVELRYISFSGDGKTLILDYNISKKLGVQARFRVVDACVLGAFVLLRTWWVFNTSNAIKQRKFLLSAWTDIT